MLLTTRTWGIEIELNAELVEQFRNGKVMSVSQFDVQTHYPYRKTIKAGTSACFLPPGWKFVRDASCGSEFVSPPLCNTAHLLPMVNAIHDSHIQYSFRNTGFHVHVGVGDLSNEQILNVIRFCRYFERSIYSYCAPRRQRNKYCRPVNASDTNLGGLLALSDGDEDRYRGCNFQSVARHGTLEFRYAEGTDNIKRMESLIDLFTSIVEVGKSGMRYHIENSTAIKRVALLDILAVSDENRKHLLSQNGWKYNKPLLPAVV